MFDSALIKMIQSDKNKGLSNLIDQYTPLVYTVVRNKIYSVCSAEDVEEVISDVFITFYNQIERVDLSKGSIAAYLMVIAKRKAVDKFRKASENQEIKLLDEDDEFLDLPDSFNLEDEIQQRDIRQKLISIIHALGEPDSTIIIHRFYLGESSKEIAAVTGLGNDNVRKRLSRALRKIEKELKGENYEI